MRFPRWSLFLLFLAITVASCHAPSYTFSRTSSAYGPDFREGKWLLNEIQAPFAIREQLRERAEEEFSGYLGEQLHLRRNVGGLLLPGAIPFSPDKKELQALKDGTGFDFIINIKAEALRNDLGDLQVGSVRGIQSNEAQVLLEVYDLNLREIVYIQQVFANIRVQDDSKDFAFAKSANNLLLGAFKRIMKKIRKQHS